MAFDESKKMTSSIEIDHKDSEQRQELRDNNEPTSRGAEIGSTKINVENSLPPPPSPSQLEVKNSNSAYVNVIDVVPDDNLPNSNNNSKRIL